jgi:photosystem II stability/assembly factor-like uncharacterized protein
VASAVCIGCVIPLSSNSLGSNDGGATQDSFVDKDVGVVTGTWNDVTANLVGLASTCGNMQYVSSRPDKDELIAGVSGDGLWASANAATTWTQLGQNDGGANVNHRTTQITYDPTHPGTFWESGAYGPCAFVTTDDGATFSQLGTETHCDTVSVDFTDPARQTLLAGGHENHSLYLSTNGGSSFTDIGSSVPGSAGYTQSALVMGKQEYLVGTWNGSSSAAPGQGNGIFRTTNGGSSWMQVYSGAIHTDPLISSDGSIYWALFAGGIVKSVDHGATWQPIPGSAPVTYLISTSLAELPDGRLMATTQQNLIVSTDHGSTWTPVGPPLPFAPAGMTYSAFRSAAYIWHFDCNQGAPNPIRAGAIMQLDFR